MSVSSVSSSLGTLNGYGGLASGLDRDSLIESMTYGTQTKIMNKEKDLELLQWEQDAIRDLTELMYNFTQKYTSYTSSSNLYSSALYSGNQVSASGDYSDLISVSANNVTEETIKILGIKSLATDSKMISNSNVSDQLLKTAGITNNFSTTIAESTLEGGSIKITYGSTSYNVSLLTGEEYDYTDPAKAAAAINKSMENVTVSGGKKLSEIVEASVNSAGKFVLSDIEGDGNNIELSGGNTSTLINLGFLTEGQTIEDLGEDGNKIASGGLTASSGMNLIENVSMTDKFADSRIAFTYNGTTEWFELGSYSNVDDMAADLQAQFDDAFGNGRVTVGTEADSLDPSKTVLTFETTRNELQSDGTYAKVADTSSTLSIAGDNGGILGNEGLFGIMAGESNRLNTRVSIAEAGYNSGNGLFDPTSGTMTISNGTTSVNLMDHGLTWDSSIDDIIETINSIEDLDIEISYQAETDKFTVKSTQSGTSGTIELGGEVATALFGTDNTVTQGTDAVLRVQYAGSDESVEIVRGSNSFEVDGLSVTAKGTFGYEGDTFVEGTDPIEFTVDLDTEKTTEIVKDMVEEYNEIIKTINDLVNEKPNRDYEPLTDEEREQLTESQIEKWEAEAKKGLLYNDSDLRNLMDSVRFILPATMYEDFKEIGITTSTNYEDNGKLIFDENAFKKALEEDPDNVKEIISGDGTVNADGTTNPSGLIVNMQEVLDRYAGMTGADKGILVERAGSELAPTSIIENSLQQAMEDMQEQIDALEYQLQMEEDRYIKQFTSLEMLISEMNSQSSYISGMFA